jgi:FkbM family methyltransferase
MVNDILDGLKTHTIVGAIRNYRNNPNKRDDVRYLPDLTQTYCFGFDKRHNYINNPELLCRFIENSINNEVVSKTMSEYSDYRYVPTIDFFDPLAFSMISKGATIKIIENDIIGGTNTDGKRINKYGILNRDMDFGDKIAHFASVGSGLNFLNMIQANKPISVPSWYVEYALGKLDLYMRLFYNAKVLDDEKNKTFLELYEPLKKAFFNTMLIFDIGANIGKYTQTHAVNPKNTIISVEASPDTFNILKYNTAKFSNVTALEYAVCNADTPFITFYKCEANTISTLDINWLTSNKSRFGDYREKFTTIQVKTITLDALIEKYGVPDVLKIDVEGAEEQVIRSLSKKVPIILFEWAAEWRDSLKLAIDHLTSLGFTKFHVQKEDLYSYYPLEFELTSDECKMRLDESIVKVDWGMIWAK